MPKFHILFAEDDELIRELIAEVLVEVGCDVTEAYNAKMALSFFEKKNYFDLLLTDVHMPGALNGIDLAIRARSVWPEIPVVFATARPNALEAIGVPGPRPGCVVKPYALGDLLAEIGVTSRAVFQHSFAF